MIIERSSIKNMSHYHKCSIFVVLGGFYKFLLFGFPTSSFTLHPAAINAIFHNGQREVGSEENYLSKLISLWSSWWWPSFWWRSSFW